MLFTTVTEGACHKTDINVHWVTIFIAAFKIAEYHTDDDTGDADYDKDDDDGDYDEKDHNKGDDVVRPEARLIFDGNDSLQTEEEQEQQLSLSRRLITINIWQSFDLPKSPRSTRKIFKLILVFKTFRGKSFYKILVDYDNDY